MKLERVKAEAESLSITSLSEPWSVSEQKITAFLPSWQRELIDFGNKIPPQAKDKLQQANNKLSETLSVLSDAIRSQNSVKLSNSLVNSFIPTLLAIELLG